MVYWWLNIILFQHRLRLADSAVRVSPNYLGFLVLDKVFGIYLTATALIGFIALIGIAVNNAIILLEYTDTKCAEKDFH